MNTINVNGITIRYMIEGSGPWVTLSHSLACDLTLWDELTAVLKKHFTVLRYDTRGHGGTSLPKSAPEGPYSFEQLTNDLLALLDVLKIERSHFVGISMGGMIGQHLALAEPQRLGRLVLANTTSRVPPEAGALWEERFAQVRAHGTAALAEATLERWFTAPFRATHPQLMARVTAMIAATSVRRLHRLRRGDPPPRHQRPARRHQAPDAGHRRRRRSRHAAGRKRSHCPRHSRRAP